MNIKERLPYLKPPGADDNAEFQVKDNYIVDEKSGRKYSITGNMINFTGSGIEGHADTHVKSGLMFKLNTFFSHYLDLKILTSIFAGGGIAFSFAKKKICQWRDQVAKDKTLFLEPELKDLLHHIGHENCLTAEDLNSKNVLPLPADFPDLNISFEEIPIKTNTFQNIISFCIMEHTRNPEAHFKELARILKPGGYLILMGPGDAYPSHRVPHNYFNIIRYGYHAMIRENGLEVVEEYYPFKSWLSILYLCNATVVRNSWYNTNQLTKLIQMGVFLLSLVFSPFLNLIACLLDAITPFDHRVYAIYMALIRKPEK